MFTKIKSLLGMRSKPEEFAREILLRYYYTLPNNGSLNHGLNSCESRYKEAIDCALIEVENIIVELEFIIIKMMEKGNELEGYIMDKINVYDQIKTELIKMQTEKESKTGETTIEFPKQHQPEPYNPNRASLDNIKFEFIQDENCVDGGEGETLIVEAKSSLGIDGDGGAFYVLRTKQWAFSNVDEFITMMKRVEAAVNATNPTSIHVK